MQATICNLDMAILTFTGCLFNRLLEAAIDEAALPLPYIKQLILLGFSLDQSVRYQPNKFFTKRGEHGIWDLSDPKDLNRIVTLAYVGMDVRPFSPRDGMHFEINVFPDS
jgi:hypothetical protein